MSNKETYLGDGLYAHIDCGTIWLRAPRDGGDHEVALEPEVYKALLQFVADEEANEAERAYERRQEDGECYRGGEYAAALAESQARCQLELKR